MGVSLLAVRLTGQNGAMAKASVPIPSIRGSFEG
jgi:hypothetical protein